MLNTHKSPIILGNSSSFAIKYCFTRMKWSEYKTILKIIKFPVYITLYIYYKTRQQNPLLPVPLLPCKFDFCDCLTFKKMCLYS